MTGADVIQAPASFALIAAGVLVLATFTAGLFTVVDFIARAITDKH